MAQMTSPRLLQADTTLIAGSEIQCMVRETKGRRPRDNGDGGTKGLEETG